MTNRLIGTIFTLVAIVAVAWAGYSTWRSYTPNTHGPRQALFLTDGQVYFGYASSIKNPIVTLKDIYYLQAATSTLQSGGNGSAAAPANQQVNLVKLGSELHGPTDVMMINRNQIKFIEDMKSDSQVNQKITDYLDKQAKPATK